MGKSLKYIENESFFTLIRVGKTREEVWEKNGENCAMIVDIVFSPTYPGVITVFSIGCAGVCTRVIPGSGVNNTSDMFEFLLK